MTLRKCLGVSAGIILTIGTSALATTNADFYCNENGLSPPTFFDKAVENCGSTKGAGTTLYGVCAELTNCTYISEDLKNLVKATYGKSFSALTAAEKKTFFSSIPLEWFPSVLTCSGKETPPGVLPPGGICPAPNFCKGDVSFNQKPAAYSFAEELQNLESVVHGQSNIFQDSNGAPAQ